MVDRVRDWLEVTACPVSDPIQEERVGLLARKLAKSMRQEGKFFSFRETSAALKISAEELLLVKERVYQLALRHVLADYVISERDRTGLRWIARALGLSDEQAGRVELRVGRNVFKSFLTFAISGGFLDDEELKQLRTLASSLGRDTQDLLSDYLTDFGEQFLESVLAGMAPDGTITDDAWKRLLSSAQALGMPEPDFLRLLQAPSDRLAEQVLNNTQASDDASYARYRGVLALLDRLNVPDGLEA